MDCIVKVKIKYDYKYILVVESLYSLALYVYIKKNQVNNTLFMVGKNIFYDEIFQDIDNYLVYDEAKVILSRKEILFKRFGFFPKKFLLLKMYIKNNCEIYGHDHLNISLFFDLKKMILIEDGLSNYCAPTPLDIFRKVYKIILNIPIYPFGYSKSDQEIYLTKIKEIPYLLKRKVNLIERETYLNAIPKLLNSRFSYSLPINSKFQLLVSQPLSEDGFISEINKIKIFKNRLNSNLPIVIKPHPRERTDYKLFFPKAYIIPNYVLVETLFNHKELSEVITFNSTAVIDFHFKGNIKINICLEKTVLLDRNILDMFIEK